MGSEHIDTSGRNGTGNAAILAIKALPAENQRIVVPPLVEAVTAVTEEKTKKAAATVTLEHVKAVALTVKTLGGPVRLYELLGLIKSWRLKKFQRPIGSILRNRNGRIPF